MVNIAFFMPSIFFSWAGALRQGYQTNREKTHARRDYEWSLDMFGLRHLAEKGAFDRSYRSAAY